MSTQAAASAPVAPASTTHTLSRERRFETRAGLLAILAELTRTHSTGVLRLDISQGTVGAITFEERQRLASVDSK